MKKSRVLQYLFLLSSLLTFVQCTDSSQNTNSYFWAQTTYKVGNYWYKVQATKITEGTYCVIYLENANKDKITTTQVENIKNEFDNTIYTNIKNNFGDPSDVDGNGKITLLLLDIKDGFDPVTSDSYVAGYFDPNQDFDDPYSNKMDMLYMDLYPHFTSGTLQDFYNTIAHEFQHLINFNETYFVQNSGVYFDTWINEGMSSAAEKINQDSQIVWKINTYKSSSTIVSGRNFLYWSGSLDNYTSVYLFFQWLSIQASNGDAIYKTIMLNSSANTDYLAVLNAATLKLTNFSGSTWSDLLGSWFAANILLNSSGLYGYGTADTTNFSNLVTSFYSSSTASLRPGYGVYCTMTPPYSISPSGDINYLSVDTTIGSVDFTTPYSGDYLIAYNINGNAGGSSVTTDTLPAIVSQQSLSTMRSLGSPINISHPIDKVFDISSQPEYELIDDVLVKVQ